MLCDDIVSLGTLGHRLPGKINGSGMEKEEREETPLQGEDESRRSSPP